MNIRAQQILLHLAGCMLVLTLPLLFSPESLSLHDYLVNPPTQREILFYALLLVAFYLNYYGLIPRYYFTRKYFIFFLFNIICFFIISFLPAYLFHGSHGSMPPGSQIPDIPNIGLPPTALGPSSHPLPRHGLFMDISQHLFVYLVALFLALLLKIRERLKQAEKDKLQAELSYLKAQINPHFLFNTLNNIYSLTLERSEKASDAVIKLSEMMRYVLDESGKELVTLQKELAYIRNYIALQAARFGPTIQLDYHIQEPAGSCRIAPLLLIPFIENAFKHGVNPEEGSRIYIDISLPGDTLQLNITNKKVNIHHVENTTGGLGIANTRQRLQLLYPGRHTLKIEDTKDEFRVFVILPLTRDK